MAHMGPHARTRRGRKGSEVADHGELVLVAMAGTARRTGVFPSTRLVVSIDIPTRASASYRSALPEEETVRGAVKCYDHVNHMRGALW